MRICNLNYCPSTTDNPPSHVTAKLDSGATDNYFSILDTDDCLEDVEQVSNGPTAITPTSDTITATKKGKLPFSNTNLSDQARTAHTFEGLTSTSLVSVAKMCDDGCKVTFDRDHAYVTKDNKLQLTGYRNQFDRLWDIYIPRKQHTPKPTTSNTSTSRMSSQHKVSVILRKDKSKTTLAQYHHHTLFAPTEKTLRHAIKNKHLITWPGLTQELFTSGLPPSEATARGHLKQERKNLQSTKPKSILKQITSNVLKFEDEEEDFAPRSDTPNTKTNDVVYALIDPRKVKQAAIDLTGKFPYTSRRGNQYILVGYHYDANYITAVPLKNRTAGEITKAWKQTNETFSKAGIQPNTYVMDNETSKELLHALTKNNIQYQLAPPHIHRTNAAEKAIQTFKNHFTSGLSVCNSKFPIEEWDHLIPQAIITLNLLRSSRNNPSLSAYAYVHGNFDYNATPMAPPGTKVIVHDKPGNRGSWDLHGSDGWYIGPSMQHYRCVKCFMSSTKSIRNADTVAFFPETIPLPTTTLEDHLRQATTDIIRILTKPTKTTRFPSLEIGDATRNGLLKVAKYLQRDEELPPLQPPIMKKVTFSPTTKTTSSHKVIKHPPGNSTNSNTTPSLVETPTISTQTSKNSSALPRVKKKKLSKVAPAPRVSKQSQTTQIQKANKKLLKKVTKAIRQLQSRYQPTASEPTRKSTRIRRPSSRFTKGFHTATNRLLAQHLYETNKTHLSSTQPINAINHIYDANGKKLKIHDLMSDPKTTDVWTRAMSNELGRLAQSNKYGVKSTDTIEFIKKSEVPKGRDITYANFILDYRPLKSEPNRVRLTVGGDKLSYDDDAGSPAASILETKIMLNSVISDAKQGARFMGLDLKDFFLASPMARPEFMRIHYKHFPQDIKEMYNIDDLKAPDDYVYVRIKRGMYGLKQAAILAFEFLVQNLSNYGYKPVPHSLSIWTHETRPISFCLCVDDFGIKYFNKEDAQHLLSSLQNHYTVTTDWEGKNFCGLTLDWNYDKQFVDISMPKYIKALLQKLQYKPSKYPQYSPHHYDPIIFGRKGQQQMAKQEANTINTPTMPKEKIRYVQSVVGSLLYYARAIDSTMLTALNDISKSQANPTEKTLEQCQRLLDYANTYQNVKVRFYASDMILNVDTDAAYLVLPKARSRLAGYFYMGHNRGTQSTLTALNGAILVECKTINHVVASAAEAETAALFHNAQMCIPIRRILEALGHHQPPTPIKTDNSTAHGFTYDNINQKRSKSWDMRYYWLRDKKIQKLLDIFWESGLLNHADYHTKHHPTKHHRNIRSRYVLDNPINTINLLNTLIQKIRNSL